MWSRGSSRRDAWHSILDPGDEPYFERLYLSTMKIRLGDLRRIIREALGASGGLAAAVRAYNVQASVAVYSTVDLLSTIELKPIDLSDAFYNNNVSRGYIRITRPDKPCNGAWEVTSAWGPGIGKTVYGLGFALSPTGLLMPDRLGVLPPAVAGWKKQSGRTMMALDNHKHPPAGTDPFHDAHHTADPNDDCRMNKDGIDFLNYSYAAQGWEKGMLDSMVARHEETMTGVSSPEAVEDALFDSAHRKFVEAVK